MREPLLITLSALCLWGFMVLHNQRKRSGYISLGIGLVGMLLISPVTALITVIIIVGWLYLDSEGKRVSIWVAAAAVLVLLVGFLLLAYAVNRGENISSNSPLAILGNFLRGAINWDVYQLERGSGWVQKLFDEMPSWLQLPFVAVYGLFQPVLPAAFIEPTILIWRIIAVLRALGWYLLIPMLVLSLVLGYSAENPRKRRIWLWLAAIMWLWILFAAVRGGGDQWDNPRYRMILFLWQAILGGNVWIWWRSSKSVWVPRIFLMELVFLLFFGQWYVSRYFQFVGRVGFGFMVGIIILFWVLILAGSWYWDARRLTGKGESL